MYQPEYKTQYDRDGYVVVRGLFGPDEADYELVDKATE